MVHKHSQCLFVVWFLGVDGHGTFGQRVQKGTIGKLIAMGGGSFDIIPFVVATLFVYSCSHGFMFTNFRRCLVRDRPKDDTQLSVGQPC